MRLTPLVIGMIGLSAGQLLAQERITIQASDRPDYSRIRLDLDGRSYALDEAGPRLFDVYFPGSQIDFDTNQIFPGRRASRVVSARAVVDAAGSRLRFSLSCDCRAAMSVKDGTLSIDFHDPGTAGAVLDDPGSVEAEAEPVAAASPEPARPARPPQTGPAPDWAPFPIAKGQKAPVQETVSKPVEAPEPPGEIESSEIQIAQQRLLEQLTRAAEQGLLSFKDPSEIGDVPEAAVIPPPPQPEAPAQDQAAPPPPPEPRVEPVALGPLELPVRARTAIDRDFPSDRSDTLVQTNTCPRDEDLAITEWGGSGDLAGDISELRRTLLGEFDKPIPARVRDLARLYIYHGLGAEAQQALRLYGAGLPKTDLLYELSYIIDGKQPSLDGVIASAGPCSGRTALWFGAGRMPAPDTPMSASIEAALLDAFSEMPVELRRILGPPLIINAVDQGNLVLASKIDLLLRRVPGPHGSAYDLAQARLLDAQGAHEQAIEKYVALAHQDGPESAEALLMLHANELREGGPISPDLTEMLAMSAFINRGNAIGRRLKVAEFSARAGSDGLPSVLDELASALAETPGDLTDLRDAGHAILESSTAKQTGPVEYAAAILDYAPNISRDPAGDNARLVVAEELVQLGLANAALDILDPTLARGRRDALVLAGEAYLLMGQPDRTLGVLEGLEGSRVSIQRARALEALGRPEAALVALEDASGERRADLSWQAGDWAGAADAGPENRRLLAAFMAGQDAETVLGTAAEPGTNEEAFLDPPAVGDELRLRDARSVVESSKAVRDLIEEALNDG